MTAAVKRHVFKVQFLKQITKDNELSAAKYEGLDALVTTMVPSIPHVRVLLQIVGGESSSSVTHPT